MAASASARGEPYDRCPVTPRGLHPPGQPPEHLVAFVCDVDGQVGKDVAMQAAAMSPIALDESSMTKLPSTRAEWQGARHHEGKPEEMAANIAKGRLKKWFKETSCTRPSSRTTSRRGRLRQGGCRWRSPSPDSAASASLIRRFTTTTGSPTELSFVQGRNWVASCCFDEVPSRPPEAEW